MGWGSWWATAHKVTESDTTEWLSMQEKKMQLMTESHQKRTLTNVNLGHCLSAWASHEKAHLTTAQRQSRHTGKPKGLSYRAHLFHSSKCFCRQPLWFLNQAPDVGVDVGCAGGIQGHMSDIPKATVQSAYLEMLWSTELNLPTVPKSLPLRETSSTRKTGVCINMWIPL